MAQDRPSLKKEEFEEEEVEEDDEDEDEDEDDDFEEDEEIEPRLKYHRIGNRFQLQRLINNLSA